MPKPGASDLGDKYTTSKTLSQSEDCTVILLYCTVICSRIVDQCDFQIDSATQHNITKIESK